MSTQRNRSFVLLLLGALALAGCPADPGDGPNAGDGGAEDAGDAGNDDPRPRPSPDKGDEEENGHPKPDAGAVDPGDEPGPVDPEDPGDPQDPVEPSDPSDPSDPVEPGDPNADERFFLPAAGEAKNTRAAKVVLDAQGNLHAIYPAYAGGDAYYAFCPDACDDPSTMESVELPAEGTVLNAMIAVTRDGRPRVLMNTALDVIYAECDGDCTDPDSWRSAVIDHHNGDRDVTGNAFALDGQDRPRFVMHTYVALLGIGQKPPATFYAACDGDCLDSSSWQVDTIQDQIWQSSQLRFDAQGRAHLATVAVSFENNVPGAKQGAYLVCESGSCTTAEDWSGIVLAPAFENYAQEIDTAIAMALTQNGGPRIILLARGEGEGRLLAYFECDDDCAHNNWRYAGISAADQIGSGVDIQLDAQAHPRFAFTLNDNIGVYYCDDADCTREGAPWDLTKVEFASDLAKDDIILWPNCTVDAWVLHDPSFVLLPSGALRVGYEATDISGVPASTQDPTKPACLAGKDMTLARMALLPSYK